MLRKHIPLFGFLLLALIVLIGAENQFAPSFQSCISQESSQQTPKDSKEKRQFIVVGIEAQIICSLRLVDTHSGFFAVLAAFCLATFTFTLKRSTDKLWEASERQFAATYRPWVGLLGLPEITSPLVFTASGASAAILLTIKNVGNSPAFNTVLMNPRLIVGDHHRDPRTYIADTDYRMVDLITASSGLIMLPGDPIPWPINDFQVELLDGNETSVSVWLSGYFVYRDGMQTIHTSSFLFSFVTRDGNRIIQPTGTFQGRFERFGFGWKAT